MSGLKKQQKSKTIENQYHVKENKFNSKEAILKGFQPL